MSEVQESHAEPVPAARRLLQEASTDEALQVAVRGRAGDTQSRGHLDAADHGVLVVEHAEDVQGPVGGRVALAVAARRLS
jgi:hypothetical protein